MANRRGFVAGAAGAAALLLSGCGPRSLQTRLNRAAESVDGVSSSDLEVGSSGTFGPQMTGTVHCSVSGDDLETVFDAVWREVVTLLHDAGDGVRDVSNVHAEGADGSIVNPADWLPEGERNSVITSDFYARYELG